MSDEPADAKEIAICNRCNTVRTLAVHPCISCQCPEYRIETVSAERFETICAGMANFGFEEIPKRKRQDPMSDMTLDEFVRQVKRMRQRQKEFFRLAPGDRPPQLIRDAKVAEKAVDDTIAEFQQGQGTLFGDKG